MAESTLTHYVNLPLMPRDRALAIVASLPADAWCALSVPEDAVTRQPDGTVLVTYRDPPAVVSHDYSSDPETRHGM